MKTSINLFDINSLFEFSRIVNSSTDIKFILNHFLLTAMGKLLCSSGIILLKNEENSYRVQVARGFTLHTQSLTIKKPPKGLIYLTPKEIQRGKWVKLLLQNKINISIPLISKNNIVGIVGVRRVTKKKLSKDETTYFKSLANIASTAIEEKLNIDKLKKINRELDRKIHELNTLFDLSKEFNIVLDREKLIKIFTLSLIGQIGTYQYAICLKDSEKLEVIASRLKNPLNKQILEYFGEIEAPTYISSIKLSKNIKSQLHEIGLKILVPIHLHNKVKGIIALGNKMNNQLYSQSDMEFLYSLGNLAIISLENSRLFEEAIEKQKMEDELLIARDIQYGLLPKNLPKLDGYDVAAINISSKQVGGDYYDLIKCSDSKYIVAIGDVSGKGMPASLLMANLQAMIRALVPFDISLSELTKRVNDLINESTGNDRFVTFFWGCINTQKKIFSYVNAGHNPPFLLHKNGTVERLQKGGLILGVMKDLMPYEEETVNLQPGDILLLFTDGVSEAMNQDGIEFGEEKILSLIKSYSKESAKYILDRIVEIVKNYSGSFQSDDITLVVVKVV